MDGPIWVLRALSLEWKWQGHEANHSPEMQPTSLQNIKAEQAQNMQLTTSQNVKLTSHKKIKLTSYQNQSPERAANQSTST